MRKKRILTELHKQRISESHLGLPSHRKGQNLSLNHKSNISKSLKGKPKSIEHCENISQARLGMVFSDEHIQHMCEAQQRRWKRIYAERRLSNVKKIRDEDKEDCL